MELTKMHLFSDTAPRNVNQSDRYMQMIKLMGILFLQNDVCLSLKHSLQYSEYVS